MYTFEKENNSENGSKLKALMLVNILLLCLGLFGGVYNMNITDSDRLKFPKHRHFFYFSLQKSVVRSKYENDPPGSFCSLLVYAKMQYISWMNNSGSEVP